MRTVLVLVATAALLLAPAGASPVSAATTTTCKSSDLRAERTDGSATYSTAVEKLKVRNTGCGAARGLAKKAARENLEGKLGKTINGYELTYTRPCASCSPRFSVTARKGTKRITFVLQPGG